MPSLQIISPVGVILFVWCSHIARQRLAWLIREGRIDAFNLKEGENLEPMEFKFPLKSLLSKKTGVWYLLNRLSLILAIFCLYLATKSLWR